MRTTVLILMLASTPVAWSSPSTTADLLDTFLLERGLTQRHLPATPPAIGPVAEMVSHAIGFLGAPYRYGGNSLDSGFDCSGFVRAVIEQTLGLQIPRQADQQAAATMEIARSELQPGDLVFFNTLQRAFSHVGIYVGEGRFIHSPKSGALVRVEDMRKSYWTQRFDGARRVQVAGLNPKQSP